MRKIIATLLAGAAVAGTLIACGGDDDNTVVTPGMDGGPTTVIMPDGNMMTMLPDGNMVTMGDDAGDGSTGTGCAFTDFVNNEITSGTSGTTPAQPITSIGDPSCSYTGTPFSGLFK